MFGRRHDRGVDDLTAHRQEAFRPERLVKAPEQAINSVGLLQRLAERPDRVGVWNPIGQSQPEEAHEGQPVLDQKLRALVRQRVHRLKDQSLEHQHMIEGRPAALRSIGARNGCFERRAEHLEINQRLHPLQTVALGRQFRQPIVKIEETRRPIDHVRAPTAP